MPYGDSMTRTSSAVAMPAASRFDLYDPGPAQHPSVVENQQVAAGQCRRPVLSGQLSGTPPPQHAHGHREILGLDVATAEDGAGRPAFLRSLIARGLSGVQLVISDAHMGLVNAIGATLPGASRQRCRTLPHALNGRGGAPIARTLPSQVPKSAQPWVATLLRTVFEQPDTDAVQAQMRHVLDALEAKFPKAAAHLDAAQGDVLAFTAFPREIWRQTWSNGAATTATRAPPSATPRTRCPTSRSQSNWLGRGAGVLPDRTSLRRCAPFCRASTVLS